MISAKKLIKMARKWRKMAAQSRRRISVPRNNKDIVNDETCTTTFVVNKGHFVVYTTDETRFAMPLAYLRHNILRELFKMSEEEFGVSSDGPIRLPCDAAFMEYVVTLIKRGVAKDFEKALIRSMETCRCSSSVPSLHDQGLTLSQQIIVSGC